MTIYSKAIEALKKQGWGKGDYINPNTGCVCAMGALALGSGKAKIENQSSSDNPLPFYDIVPIESRQFSFQYHALDLTSLYQAMRELPNGKRPGEGAGVAYWNDDLAEGVRDVIALFERAHELEEIRLADIAEAQK